MSKELFEKSERNYRIARAAIIEDLKQRGMRKDPNVLTSDHGWCGAGMVKCPVCTTGELHYTRARVNGHVHARCLTPGCVSWME